MKRPPRTPGLVGVDVAAAVESNIKAVHMKISSRTKKFVVISSFYIVALRVITFHILSTNVALTNELSGFSTTNVNADQMVVEQPIGAQRV